MLSAALAAICPGIAAADAPILSATTPASPGTSLEPKIRGNADGIITSVVRPPSLGPVPRATEPNATITIYTDSACSGTVAATGTAAELEGAGIAVTVAPNSKTTFYANQTGIGGVSDCSNGLTYRQVTDPPEPPQLTGVNPLSPADQNFPRLQGSVESGAIVFLYDSATCDTAPLGSGTSAEFTGAGIEIQVGDNTTTTVYALASLAGIPSVCSSSSVTYQEVTPAGGGGGESPGGGTPGGGGTEPPSNGAAKPPVPKLRTVPGGIANNANPLLTGSAPQAAKVLIFTSTDCSGGAILDGSAAELGDGIRVPMMPNTTIVLSARSVDSDGDRSACSDPVVYTDDSIAPRTRITLGPGVKTIRRNVVFRFADITNGPQTHFLCKVDRKPWKECTAPLKLKRLGHRRHILKVKAYDAAGNREQRPVKRSFKVVRGF